MSSAIDAAGRIVIPKAIRDAAGLRPGIPLEVRFRDGRIEIEPAALCVDIVMRGGVAIAETADDVPTLRARDVAATRYRLRDERG